MYKTIEIDDDVFEVLKHHAEPFVDSPNDVLRRLLLASPRPNGGSEPTRERGHRQQTRGASHFPTKARRKRTAGGGRKRAPSNALLSEEAYKIPLLSSLASAGGRMPTREAIAAVGECVRGQLKPMDREMLEHVGRERWEMRVQFVRLRLAEEGLLEKGSPRGVWEISGAGRSYLDGARSSK
jgi:hypothetical protein